jgi:hypothetical protein
MKGTINQEKNITSRFLGIIFALIPVFFGVQGWAERLTVNAGSHVKSQSQENDSKIIIRFADPKIPDIVECGRSTAQPYGVYDNEQVQRAKDEVAAQMPMPEIKNHELLWDSHDQIDQMKLNYLATTDANGRPLAGSVNGYGNQDEADYGYGNEADNGDDDSQFLNLNPADDTDVLGAEELIRRDRVEQFEPSAPDHYPIYNLMDYYAELGEWRRGLERAASHGIKPVIRIPASSPEPTGDESANPGPARNDH